MNVSSGGGGNDARKKRRRQRGQRNKRHGPSTSSTPTDSANRERIFQDIEGLLRQIRERAEELGNFSATELEALTQTVVGLFKGLESEAQIVSDRSFHEYQRVREKLSQVLREQGEGAGDPSAG